jgi:hypothetical protein
MNRMTLVGAPIAALLLPFVATATASSAAAAAPHPDASAKVWSADATLKKCAAHTYRYAVDVPKGPGDTWSLSTRLVNRNGRTVAFDYKVSGGDPVKGRGKLRFCNLKPGAYKVRSELLWQHYSKETVVKAKPRTIKLRRP